MNVMPSGARVVMLAATVFLSQGWIMAEDSPSDAMQRIGTGIARPPQLIPTRALWEMIDWRNPTKIPGGHL
jgi:hypothetical protein